jgi:hypothetical protein
VQPATTRVAYPMVAGFVLGKAGSSLAEKRREARAKETRGQVLRLCLESLVMVLMVAFVFGGVVTLGRHTVAIDTHRTDPQAAGRFVAYVDTEGRVSWVQEGVTDSCAVLDTPKSKDIEVSSAEQKQGPVREDVDCGARHRTLGGSTRVPGGRH